MSDKRKELLSRVLDHVEQRESRLLVWGIVDGFFSREELGEIVDPLIDAALEQGNEEFFQADDLITALRDLTWLVEVEGANGALGFRSRMAETVRLLLRLRQLFPKHARPGGWQQASTLVADFRFQRRQRQYPRRDVSADSVLTRLRAVTSNPAIHLAAKALLAPSNSSFMLSGFQVRAAERIIRGIETDAPLGTIVCAGTGSGKTLAFYLPALASITRHLIKDGTGDPWVKTIALYPRTELLKDQLREVLGRVLSLRASCSGDTNANVRIGAFYSDTPASAHWCDWPQLGQDRICPSLRCLECDSDLRWLHTDRSVGRERLVCNSCHFEIDGNTLPLTREAMRKFPPDILFTTTEMLNQRLSDNSFGHLFGVGPKAKRPPELVLMDEVHTYDGRHGAQVAYLMRRWQRLLEQPLRFVGLSATLREAPAFFASLTGGRANLIEEISPHANEIESEGAEYMVALRGDPVSRSALLSTTIQTTMLLQRCLDPRTPRLSESISNGAFGQRTFVFTDNLDIINRLYFDLMSAEGRTSFGSPDMRNAPNGGLAMLRRSGTSRLRYHNGQDWRFCEGLGHQLSTRLVIERVSSQDRGIDANADVVVATAALEVGFDDPTVGAVVQHKAPKGMAGFLQRKGRAGRTRGMRPWTAIVLSDYGRDRIAYQGYDLLFDPELPVRTLPLANRYITRMQAVFATIDFLGQRLQDAPSGSVWRDLAGPGSELRGDRLQKEIRLILESANGTKRLQDYLQRALKVSVEEVEALLWEYPRPLMTTALPTALRRLVTKWRADGQPGHDFQIRNNPLPDFIPATLFAELNLAEVRIGLPHIAAGYEDDQPSMSVFQAMREFAPGRVSRRYGLRSRTERHWLAPSIELQAGVRSQQTESTLDIDTFGTHTFLGEFALQRDGTRVDIPVFRPIRINPVTPPRNVTDSSNAQLLWQSQFVPEGQPIWLTPPSGSVWSELVTKLGFYMHAHHAPVEIRRFAIGATAEIGVGPGDKLRTRTLFEQKSRAVGLGAAFHADGVVFNVCIPVALHGQTGIASDTKWRSLRTARFLDVAWRGEVLAGVPSPFMREWLAQIFLSSLTYESIYRNVNLASAAAAIAGGTCSVTLNQVLSILFQSNVVDLEDEIATPGGQDKLRIELDACLQSPEIVAELLSVAKLLWEPISDEWEQWLRNVYQSTLAAGLLRSITDLCPTLDPDDLCVDLSGVTIANISPDSGDSRTVEIWITERSPGGSGLIEEFLRVYAEDPRRFFSTVRASLEMGEFELIDHQLNNVLQVMIDETHPSKVRNLVQQFRSVSSHDEMTRASSELRKALVQEGFSPFHGFMVSMANRLLRPGAGPATDQYLAEVLRRWNSEEERLGLEIDLRVICYWLSQSSDIDDVVAEVGVPLGQDNSAWRLSAIYGLLWARGRAIRQTSLQMRNPFSELPKIERLLVAASIGDDRVRIRVGREEWLIQASELLATGKMVTLTCDESKRSHLADALNALITNPIDAGYIRSYARLQGIRQTGATVEADIELLEALQ